MDEITNIMLQQNREVDERDEAQILAELAGESLEEYIYEIPAEKNRKRAVKLSWAGTREMARARGNISLSDPLITDQDGYVRVVVRATDLRRNFSVFGGCHQPKQQKVKIYNEKHELIGTQQQDDPYYFTKALSKAQRNVIQSVIPAGFMAKMVDRFLTLSGRPPLRQLAPPPKPKQNKPRLDGPLPEVNFDELTNLGQLEILAYNRWHIQPAEMYAQLSYKGKADCTESPWECFLKLKATYEP